MPSVTFTTALPVVRQELTPPPGATAVIIHATVTSPAAGSNCRLFHLRTLNSVVHPNLPAEGRLPRESEIVELIVRNGTLTAGFSGKGGNRTSHPVVHMGSMPQSFPVTLTVPFSGKAAVVAAGSLVATSDTDIAPGGQPLELLLGMEPIIGADLQPPIGFTVSWDEHAVEWVGAQQPAPPLQPPSVPPAQPPVSAPAPPVVTPPVPPIVLPPAGTTASPEQAALQALAIQLASGQPVNAQTLLAALLPILLQRIG